MKKFGLMTKINRSPGQWIIIGTLVLIIYAGAMLTFRPLFAYWLQQQGGMVVLDLSRNLPAESGGFACLAEPFKDEALRAQLTLAISQLEQARSVLPQQAHLYYLLGRAYCMAGQYDLAVQTLPEFTELRPKNPQADLELGFALEKLCPPRGECEGLTTIQVWRRVGVKFEDLIQNGDQFLRNGALNEAKNWYSRARLIKEIPRGNALFLSFLEDSRKGIVSDETVSELKFLIRDNQSWSSEDMRLFSAIHLNSYLISMNLFKDVEMVAKNFIESYVEVDNCQMCADLFFQLGISLAEQGNLPQGLEYIKKGLFISPNNAWGLVYFGVYSFYLLKDETYTDEQFEKSIGLLAPSEKKNILIYIISFWQKVGISDKTLKYCNYFQESDRIEVCR